MKMGEQTKHFPLVVHARMMNGTGGGPDKTIINSPRFLKTLGFNCFCAFYRPPCDEGFAAIRSRAESADAEIIEIDDGGIMDFAVIRKTIQLCRERNVDIWHAHDYKTNLIGWIVSKFHKMRLITTAHGWVDYTGRLPTYYKYEKRWVLPQYEKVICVSETVMNEAIAGGTPQSKCILIENAIDHEQFSRRRLTAEAKLEDFDLGNDTFLIGSIGRLSTEKGFDLLIDAVASLSNEGLNIKLIIAGEGPQKANLQNQINSLGMQERIQLFGFCSDTRSFYESLDLFVLSSHREGLPNVVLESMAVGTPVLATAVDGVPRVITDGLNGRLIPPGSSKAIATQIKKLMTDSHIRELMGEYSVKIVQEKWSFHNRMKQISRIYAD